MSTSNPTARSAGRSAIRAAILRFAGDDQLERIEDGLLVVENGVVIAAGDYQSTAPAYPDLQARDWRDSTLAPGFVDMHIHYPQTDVIGSPAEGLLPWLENYTFPHESRFVDSPYATEVAEFFLDELMRNGVTTALAYSTSHVASVDAYFAAAHRRGLRAITGKCLMDSNCPDGVRDATEQSLVDSQALIERWHGRGRLGYALTPRFAPSCTAAQMSGAAALADRYPGVWIQTHVAENTDEIAWVRQLFPESRSYLGVYESMGLLRPRSVYAHCIYFDDNDRAAMRAHRAAAAVCPTSNLFLGSGLFDFDAASRTGMSWGLASDVGGGTSFSPFHTMLAAYQVARLRGVTLSPQSLWYAHTLGAARALDLGDKVGNLAAGFEADFIRLDANATPLLARRSAAAHSLAEWLFALIVLGDDRVIRSVTIAGQLDPQ